MNLVKVVIALILCGIVIEYGNRLATIVSVGLTLVILLCIFKLEFGGKDKW